MKKFKINPFRLLVIGMVIVIIGSIAKITKESFYQPILIIGLIIELISVLMILNLFNKIIKHFKRQ
jgi:hypothetical protein